MFEFWSFFVPTIIGFAVGMRVYGKTQSAGTSWLTGWVIWLVLLCFMPVFLEIGGLPK